MCKKVHFCQPIFFDFELAVGQLGPLSGPNFWGVSKVPYPRHRHGALPKYGPRNCSKP